MMTGYDDRVRNDKEVCNIFDDLFPEKNPQISTTTLVLNYGADFEQRLEYC